MLFFRAFVAASSLLMPAQIAPANVSPMTVISPEAIVRVICYAKDGTYSGTAFRVGPDGQLLSVNHVTSSGECYIGGKPIGKVWKSPTADFSMVDGDEGPYLQVDCGGFVKGRTYIAMGYARGESDVQLDLVALGQNDTNGQALLISLVPVIPGMSGGPIVSADTGKVVGVVNAENFEEGVSWSVALRDTPICKGKIA